MLHKPDHFNGEKQTPQVRKKAFSCCANNLYRVQHGYGNLCDQSYQRLGKSSWKTGTFKLIL